MGHRSVNIFDINALRARTRVYAAYHNDIDRLVLLLRFHMLPIMQRKRKTLAWLHTVDVDII